MTLTLSTIPGYTDLSDSVLAAGQAARSLHVEAISSNAAFAMVRTEVFQGLYFNGDTVPLPVSPIDGYPYTRAELIYFYNCAVSTNKDSGWIQIGSGSFWFCNWFVDQSTGAVSSLEWYRNSGSGGTRTETNDGQIIVYTIAQRQRQNLIQSVTPVFSAVSAADIATDKPWKQSLAQGLNDDAKFACTNKEIFYCGEFTNGTQVPRGGGSALISPADGYAYQYSECKFMAFWRWTTNGASLTQPPEIYAQLGPFAWSIDSSGNVSTYVEAIDNDGNDHVVPNAGRVGVVAFCVRAGTPGSATLSNSFSELDENLFVPGNSLRASNVLKIKQNIDEAILTPEFFGVTEYKDGDTIPLPVSPVDGYTYTRDELVYIWSWDAVRPNTGSHVRIPVFYGSINQTSGAVALACWRLTDHYVDDNNTFCRINVMIVARRQHPAPAAIGAGNANPPSDSGTTPVGGGVNPYGIAFDQGGGRTTLVGSSESLLMHGVTSNLVAMVLPDGLAGSTAGCRVAPTGSYTITININGTARGSILFSAGNTVGTFSFAGPITTVPGDRIEFVAGAADATILGIFWTIVGSRI